jgi:RNA polymerase sigma-70 factor (ECF subfamily)
MESPFNNNELLIKLLHEHDPKTYELLYDTYCAALHGNILELIANRELAERILLKAFQTAFKTIRTFDSSKSSLYVWLLHIAMRHCHALMRALKSWPSPEQVSEASGMMVTILRDMPDGPRQAIELMYFRGYSRRQVAEVLQVSTDTVKLLLDQGLQQLHVYFTIKPLAHA